MNIEETVLEIAKKARAASLELAVTPTEKKNAALLKLAELIEKNEAAIIEENKKDIANASGLSSAFIDRLTLTPARIRSMAEGVRQVAALPDPLGEVISQTIRPNGLDIRKVRCPIGVIGIIYESRPNVTIDCAVLCLKSGNASILRGGKEAFNSNTFLAGLVTQALKDAGLNPDCSQFIPTADRAALAVLLKLDSYVHCIIPRGGEKLIRFVVENSSIPVIKHYKGVCNIYADATCDVEQAKKILINAKCQRPATCNAVENLLVDKDAPELMLELVKELQAHKVQVRCDEQTQQFLLLHGVTSDRASEQDFFEEYGDLIISAKFVNGLSEAINFINTHSSGHSDAILTSDEKAAEEFLNSVDSACVYWNASTRFSDGFEFGLGAEIGISTDKLHARGPMGLAELCTYKYKIFGKGQTRA